MLAKTGVSLVSCELGSMRRSGTAPCSSCAPPPRLPLRTVPTDPSAERSVPAALLAQPSFDVSMAKQSSQRGSQLDDGTSFTLPRLRPTKTETEVIVAGYRVISEELRVRSGDILIKMASLGYPSQPPIAMAHAPPTLLKIGLPLDTTSITSISARSHGHQCHREACWSRTQVIRHAELLEKLF